MGEKAKANEYKELLISTEGAFAFKEGINQVDDQVKDDESVKSLMDKYNSQADSFINALSEDKTVDANLYLGRMVALSNLLLMNGVDVSAIPIGAASLSEMDESEQQNYPGGTLGLVSPDYADTVTTKLSRADEFIKILGEKGVRFYGGNQQWFEPNEIGVEGGCGTVAAANILTYISMYHPDMKNLFYDEAKKIDSADGISKDEFSSYMNMVYQHVTPTGSLDIYYNNMVITLKKTLGIPTVSMFSKGVKSFAESEGIELESHTIGGYKTLDSTVKFIKEGLKKDSPVALLNWLNPELKNIQWENPENYNRKSLQNFQLHWVTITTMNEDTRTGEVYIDVSSWGGNATLNLKDVISVNTSWFTYFEPIKK